MSEFRSDRSGGKAILAACVCTLAALALLVLSGTGASIDCTQNACTLKRHELGHASEERFSWTEVSAVRMRPAAFARTVSSSREGVSRVNVVLELGASRAIPVYASGVAWIFGPLDYRALERARIQGWRERLYGLSLGGASLAVAVLLALCGLIFALLSVARPIRKDMTAGELKSARITNLSRLVLVFAAGSVFWGVVVFSLARGLAG